MIICIDFCGVAMVHFSLLRAVFVLKKKQQKNNPNNQRTSATHSAEWPVTTVVWLPSKILQWEYDLPKKLEPNRFTDFCTVFCEF